MIFRTAILAFGMLAATPAFAQDTTPTPTAPTAPTAAYAAEHLAAGENLARAIIFDGGAVDRIFEHMDAAIIPQLRQNIISSPLYRSANTEQRAALLRVVDNMPAFMRQELSAGLATVTVNAAPLFAQRMSAEHLNQTADFMRTPDIQERWRQMVEARIATDQPMPSFPEWRDVGTFAQTPAGQAFAQNERAIGDILDEEAERTLSTTFPRVLAAVSAQMCDALGNDCPPQLRSAGNPT